MPTSSRLILHLSRLKIAVPAANLVRCGCPAPAASSGWAVGAGARRDVDRWLSAAQARARGRGVARADLLPADSSLFPVNGCRSGRKPGSLWLPGGWRLAVGRVWAPERAPRRRSPGPVRRGRARAARSGLCRPPPGYFFTSPGYWLPYSLGSSAPTRQRCVILGCPAPCPSRGTSPQPTRLARGPRFHMQLRPQNQIRSLSPPKPTHEATKHANAARRAMCPLTVHARRPEPRRSVE